MTVRTWLHSELVGLTLPIGDRIHQNTSIREDTSTRNLTKPFLVHRFSVDRPDLRGDDIVQTIVEEIQLFVHDVPGDYTRIDETLQGLFNHFNGRVDQAQGIIQVSWLEDSEDFRDDQMGTILRYGRYQIKHRRNIE